MLQLLSAVSPREVVMEWGIATPKSRLQTSRCPELWEDYIIHLFFFTLESKHKEYQKMLTLK